jgi:hypothetical protein
LNRLSHGSRACAALVVAILAAGPSRAQVLQIDPDGSVTTYSGPTIFEDGKATPLAGPKVHTAVPSRRHLAASAEDFRQAARTSALSVDLIAAVAWRESHHRANAVSPKGAVGEMQLMPATARGLGVDPTDAGQNVRGGAAYLRQLMRRYDGDLVKSLAAYNAGPAAVDRYGGAPPYKETQAYVAAVLDQLSQKVVPVPTAKAAQR